ncbi:MAG: multiheme c-type cytochrome [Nitrospirota bacterium]|nr:multiheme c-type cytochrome [Nitrospirota bacterium]
MQNLLKFHNEKILLIIATVFGGHYHPTYQTNINLLAGKKGMAATRYCEGCHAPVALLSGQLTEGGRLDTPGHMNEGVGCLGCHAVDRVEHLEGVGSYRIRPQESYLFEGRTAAPAVWLHNLSLRIRPARHRLDMARPVVATPAACATCHAQFMDRDMNGWGWVKMQDDYTGWLNSPYSGMREPAHAASATVTRCQDCHLPLVAGKDPSADSLGRFRSHRFPGANTAIPHVTGNTEQLEAVTRFLQRDVVRVTIDVPRKRDAARGERPFERDSLTETEAPEYFYLGDRATLRVVVDNTRVGHNFPGGTTDINEVWIALRVVDGSNRVVYESGMLEADGTVDPKAHFYRTIPVTREGRAVWRHDLFNMTGDSYRNVVPPGRSDVLEYGFTIPHWAKGPLTASAVVRYRKLNIRYARWALKDERVDLPIVDMARHALTIPIRYKREQEQG